MPYLQGKRASGSSKSEAMESEFVSDSCPDPFVQNLFVLRHGEAVNDPSDSKGAWDPPLTDRGKLQAWRVGRNLRTEDWNITRVVTSPFLRCVQTAAEVIAGLFLLPCSVHQGSNTSATSSPATSSPATSLKASIECALAEMTNKQERTSIQQVVQNSMSVPGTLDMRELYSLLPREVHDTSYQPIRQTLPSRTESAADVQSRYIATLQNISNKYHTENILCITHGEGVMKAVAIMWPRVEIFGVTHCAYTHAQRPNFITEDGSTRRSGEWELLTESGSNSGIFYAPSQ